MFLVLGLEKDDQAWKNRVFQLHNFENDGQSLETSALFRKLVLDLDINTVAPTIVVSQVIILFMPIYGSN